MIVVRPTTTVVTSLVIVNAADSSWIERRTGSDGAEDRKPAVEPDCDPDKCHLTGTVAPTPATPDLVTPTPDPGTRDPVTPEPSRPDAATPSSPDPTDPAPANPDPYEEPPTDPHADPDPSADPYADPYEELAARPVPGSLQRPERRPERRAARLSARRPGREIPPEEFFPPDTEQEQPETFEG